jgi:hemoglobin/transferrin/lactoferrin receptor protein
MARIGHTKSTKKHLLPIALAALTSGTIANEKPYEEIIITATKLPRSVQDIAGTVSVITEQDIAAQQANDLNELVNYLPGVSMNTASRGGNQGFVIRGIGGNRVLTVLDGVRANDIYEAGPSSYGRDFFEVDDLRAVEIIRGPASVIYGADAMGGAVLLQSKDPRDYLSGESDTFFNLRAASTSHNQQAKLGFSSGWVGEDFETLVQFTQRDFSEREVNSDIEIDPQDGDSQSILWKSIWSPGEHHRFTFTLDALEESIITELNSEEASASVDFSRGEDKSQRYRASVSYLLTLNAALADSIESQLSWQRSDALQHTDQIRTSSSFFPPADVMRETDFEFDQKYWSADITALKSFNTGMIKHSSAYGVHFDKTDTQRPRDRVETNLITGATTRSIAILPFPGSPTEDFPNKTFPDTITTRAGIYWQNEMVFGSSGFTLIPGVRYDSYAMDPTLDGLVDVSAYGFDVERMVDSEVSFSLGTIYDISESTALFFQYAEGFRPPNYDESNQAFVNLGHQYATIPNPNLESETSKSYELGVKSQLSRTELSFAVFDNRYENFIDSAFVGMSGPLSLFQDQNINQVSIRGAEADARFYLSDSWQLSAAAAYAKGDNETDDVPLNSVDPLTTVVSLGYFANDRWSVQSFLTWADNKDRISSDTVTTADSYTALDVIAYFSVTENLSLRAGVFNVTDEEYARWANISGLTAGSDAVQRAMEPGTNYRLNLNYQF